MTDKNQNRVREELERAVTPSRRTLLRAVVGAAAVYTVPTLASFSMEGLRIGEAEAQGLTANQSGNFGSRVREVAPGRKPGDRPFGQDVSSERRQNDGGDH